MKIQEWRVQDLGADSEVLREGIVREDGLEIGRTAEGMGCPDDPQMSAQHARLFLRDGKAFIEEMGSTTGVWIRVPSGGGCVLRVDDQVWLGAQILLIRKREEVWELRHHGPDGRLREKYLVPDAGVFLGRTSGLVLDKKDSRLSRRHAQIVRDGDSLQLYDRGAHNGTYLKLVEPIALRDGDEFRVATHRFRITAILEASAAPAAPETPAEAPEEATVLQPAPVRAPAAQEVKQRGRGGTAEPKPGDAAQTSREQGKKGGLAARLKRLGRKSAQAEGDEAAPVEIGSREAEPAVDQEETAASMENFSEEATVMVFRDEPVLEVDTVEVAPPEPEPAFDQEQGAEAEYEILLETGGEAEVLSVPAAAGQTVLEAVKAAGLSRGEPLDWECGDGGCGVCVMGLVAGAEGLEPPDPEGDEMKTIQITEQVAPDPARFRLACLARVRGNVRLRRL